MNDNVTALPSVATELFAVGDVVRLNSGGPESTVVRIAGKAGKTEITVAWYDDARALTEASFPPAALRSVEPARK